MQPLTYEVKIVTFGDAKYTRKLTESLFNSTTLNSTSGSEIIFCWSENQIPKFAWQIL